jgi:hypothetical protein
VSASWSWTGLEDLKAQLRALPTELAGEGANLVEGRGNRATQRIKAGYPARTRDLRDKTTVTHTRSAFGARAVVTNTSRHALPFEIGTQARHTKLGANRGSMPPGHVFVPVMQQERRAMYDDLRDLLERHGLVVSGAA